MFSQVDEALTRSEGGLGIGLALVKGLTELHNGTVEARSPGLGQGSEFIVRLPIADPVSANEPTAEPQQDRLAGLTKLVADDNKDAARVSQCC